MLSEKEKEELLSIARKTLEVYLTERKIPSIETKSENLKQSGGAFVTLHENEALRGCIGVFEAPEPLYQNVQRMAVAAATEDPRFFPVTFEELSGIDIEISVLSPRKPIKDINEIIVGKHGIWVSRGINRGVLLPQVATEQKWNREEFLSHTCMKAGLDQDTWKGGNLNIEIFSAEVFGEK